MKWKRMIVITLLFGTLVFPLALPANAQTSKTNKVVSNDKWTVWDTSTNGFYIGQAQHVCLNSNAPMPCPLGATEYGYPFSGWMANISNLKDSSGNNARWIWAPKTTADDQTAQKITGETTPAANAEFIFKNGEPLYACDPILGGTISVAADNLVEVSVNGTPISTPTGAGISQNAVTTLSIPTSAIYGSTLFPRDNSIAVTAKNGSNPADCTTDQYKCNPAGVVMQVSIDFTDKTCNPSKPGNHGPYSTGEKESLGNCPDGQVGEVYHICACGNWTSVLNTCTIPANTPTPTPTTPPPTITTTPTQTSTPTATPLPQVGVGSICGNGSQGYTATCPSGTTCKSRLTNPPKSFWCAIFGIGCGEKTQTFDWYCDP